MVDCDPLVVAYLAGIIDADGYITVAKNNRVQGTYYGARVGIAGTRSAPHELAAAIFGGRVYCYANRDNRPQFQWHRTGRSSVAVIECLLPYLRLKHRQAVLALRLQAHVETGVRSVAALAEREAMHHEMVHDLNEWRRSL